MTDHLRGGEIKQLKRIYEKTGLFTRICELSPEEVRELLILDTPVTREELDLMHKECLPCFRPFSYDKEPVEDTSQRITPYTLPQGRLIPGWER